MDIGLVLSGGMAKGAYQVGALRALEEYIPKENIRCISGSSIGVLNGYAYATDTMDELEQMWHDICPDETQTLISHIVRSSLLQQNIQTVVGMERPLPMPLYCTLLDIGRRRVVYKDLSEADHDALRTYMKASVAIPACNRPVQADGTSYYDGAFADNIPVYPLLDKDLDLVICVYFDDVCYQFEDPVFDRKVVKIAFPNVGGLKKSLFFQRSSIDEMFREGYERSSYVLGSIFSKGHGDLDHAYRMIRHANKNAVVKPRLTVDILATNLNKVTQKLTKRKII